MASQTLTNHFLKPVHSSVIGLILACVFLIPSLSGCSSKEQQLKERQELLEKFATTVVERMFDRNPDTIKESMYRLMHEDLSQACVDKLQANKLLPETEIDVLKIIDESKRANLSNKVEVDIVRPLDPVEKDSVQIKVTGKNIRLVSGKAADDKVLSATVTCLLTSDMAGYPRATDVTVPNTVKPEAAAGQPAKQSSLVRRHRRR